MNTKRDPLGSNPLNQGIFTRTDTKQKEDTGKHKEENGNQKPEYGFLEDGEREKITLQLPIPLNEWLDGLVKKSKRQYGHKIPKQIWIQAAIELMQAMPVDWSDADSQETLGNMLEDLVARHVSQKP